MPSLRDSSLRDAARTASLEHRATRTEGFAYPVLTKSAKIPENLLLSPKIGRGAGDEVQTSKACLA
ncbi:MAG: hypothetical protein ACYTXA_23660 [Nostoc sp.]